MKIKPLVIGAISAAVGLSAVGIVAFQRTNGGAPVEPAAYAAPAKAAPKKRAAPVAASKAPVAAPNKAANGEPSEADRKAFVKVVEDVKQKIAAAKDKKAKEKAARDGLARLQQYVASHARQPIADTARLTAAHLQFQLGQTDEAIAVFRQVAARPMDKKAGMAAAMTLAQLLAQTGKTEEAQQVLAEIAAKNEDPENSAAAKLMLAQMLVEAGKVEEAEKQLSEIVTQNASPELTQAAKQGLETLSVRPGRKPPEFNIKDTDGKEQSASAYGGKVLLIDFWATWCGPCREELPNLKKVYAKFKDQGFAILGVSLDRSRADLDRGVKAEEIEWPQIFAGAQNLAQRYGVTSIPRVVILDRQGVIRHLDTRGAALEEAVASLIAQKP